MSKRSMEEALATLARHDPEIRRALREVGPPPLRRRPEGFATLLRVVVGQQLSGKAAATIYARLEAAMGGAATPEAFHRLRSPTLRAVGLSRQKVDYVRTLARAVLDGSLDLRGLRRMDDREAIRHITELKGFGVWSAQMYLMFSLGRADVWPVGDLGVREGVGRIKGLGARPTDKELEAMGEAFRPYRSSVAFFAWHYVNETP